MKVVKPKTKDAQMSIRINAELVAKLQAIAKKNGVRVSEVLRQIIADAV